MGRGHRFPSVYSPRWRLFLVPRTESCGVGSGSAGGVPSTGKLSWGQGPRAQQAREGTLPGLATPSPPEPPVCIPWTSSVLSGNTFATWPSGHYTLQLSPQPLCRPHNLGKFRTWSLGLFPLICTFFLLGLDSSFPLATPSLTHRTRVSLSAAAKPSHQQASAMEHAGELPTLLHQPTSPGQPTLPHSLVSFNPSYSPHPPVSSTFTSPRISLPTLWSPWVQATIRSCGILTTAARSPRPSLTSP